MQIWNGEWINLQEEQTLSELEEGDPFRRCATTSSPLREIDRHMIIDPEAYAWQTRTRLRSHPAMRGFLSELDF